MVSTTLLLLLLMQFLDSKRQEEWPRPNETSGFCVGALPLYIALFSFSIVTVNDPASTPSTAQYLAR